MMTTTHTHHEDHEKGRGQERGLGRRGLLAGGGAAAAAGMLGMMPAAATAAPESPAKRGHHGRMPLQFGRNGRFKIVQFNDTQDGPLTDRRTIELMERVLDREKPDFALINGDCINGSPRTELEVKQAYNNVVMPMESRGIGWAVTFGNHDEDSLANGTGMTEDRIYAFLRGYRHNLNPARIPGVTGHTNAQILVKGSRGSGPVFAIWLMDSGRYASDADAAGQSTEGLRGYDWIRPDQLSWYLQTSLQTRARYGKQTPGLMFFHIPTFEHDMMWQGLQVGGEGIGHEEAVKRHRIVGVNNEGVYYGLVNSGIYSFVKELGEVKGIYCGHDHINDFTGDYFGVELGYSPGTGFGTYGLGDGTPTMHTMRGARVFELDETVDGVYTGDTRLVYAKDLGIDMTPGVQRIEEPAAFPSYLKV